VRLIIYKRHRQTLPLLRTNGDCFFIDINKLLKFIPFKSDNINKYRVLYFILKILNPKLIVDINWTSRHHLLFKVYAKRNNIKFVVIQHGTYVAGICTVDSHKYIVSDEFWVWGDYFKDHFAQYNSKQKIRVFGNPVFNEVSREKFDYVASSGIKNILLAPSLLASKEEIESYKKLFIKLKSLGYNVYSKFHYKQNNIPVEFSDSLLQGDLTKALILESIHVVISDISTAIIDSIFAKKYVILFTVNTEYRKLLQLNYANYLPAFYSISSIELQLDNLRSLVDVKPQELLFQKLVRMSGNKLLFN
jgi:hypothetical protein